MDFSNFGNAPTEQGGNTELIPDGTLAWASVLVRPFNLDQGLVLTPSKSTEGNAYLDVELTILEGPYARRKVWDRIMLKAVGEKADKVVGMAMAKVRHILEVGREIQGFSPNDAKYRLGADGAQGDMVLMELNELRCAIKVGIDKGQGDYRDKNKVSAYLSPNPNSDTFKTFMRLVNGETAAPTPKAAAQPNVPAWQTGKPAAPTPAPQPQGRPSWAGAAPAKQSADAPW